MVAKSGDDGLGMAVGEIAPAMVPPPGRKNAQKIAGSGFAAARRDGWNLGRVAARPINLERRARFARISF